MEANMDTQLLRMTAAAEVLSVSHWTLRLWAKQGRVHTVKLGKLRMVPKTEVERLVKRGTGKIAA
jgi:excisionase family DNA binding protein